MLPGNPHGTHCQRGEHCPACTPLPAADAARRCWPSRHRPSGSEPPMLEGFASCQGAAPAAHPATSAAQSSPAARCPPARQARKSLPTLPGRRPVALRQRARGAAAQRRLPTLRQSGTVALQQRARGAAAERRNARARTSSAQACGVRCCMRSAIFLATGPSSRSVRQALAW